MKWSWSVGLPGWHWAWICSFLSVKKLWVKQLFLNIFNKHSKLVGGQPVFLITNRNCVWPLYKEALFWKLGKLTLKGICNNRFLESSKGLTPESTQIHLDFCKFWKQFLCWGYKIFQNIPLGLCEKLEFLFSPFMNHCR